VRETLELMERVASGVRPYQAQWFNECFIPSFNSHSEPNEKTVKGEDGKQKTLREDGVGITTQQLKADLKKNGQSAPSTEILLKKYIYPLLNQGIIDSTKSVIDKRAWIFFPTEEFESGIFSLFKDDDPRLEPVFFNRVTRRLIERCLSEGVDVVDYFRSAFTDLESNLDELSYSQKSTKALYDYGNNGWQRQIYDEILEDCGPELAQSKSQEGVYRFWKVKAEGRRSVTIHPERYQLNMMQYRKELFTCVEPILQAYGIEENELDRLWDELVGSGQRKKKIVRKN